MLQNSETRFVDTFLNYRHPDEKPYYNPGTASTFGRKYDRKPVKVTDLRGNEGRFSLDQHGFEFHKHVSCETEFNDESVIKDRVYKEVEELLKEKTKASRVNVFSHIVRRTPWEKSYEVAQDAGFGLTSVGGRNPARFAHVDQSYNGAVVVLNDNMKDEAAKMAKCRWGIINVWRPLKTVPRDPLAVCDGSTVRESDLVEVLAILPKNDPNTFADVSKGEGFETWEAKANPDHRWYFASDMKPDEVLFIKCFDSKKDGRVRRSPHTAFVDPATKDNPAVRESIEIRCLVFWEDDSP